MSTLLPVKVKMMGRREGCFPIREVVEAGGQVGVATPDTTATTVQMEAIVWGCVDRDALAGGSCAQTAAGTGDAIGTIGTDVPTDETHFSVGQLPPLHLCAPQDFDVLFASVIMPAMLS